jgi:hypothetical protein
MKTFARQSLGGYFLVFGQFGPCVFVAKKMARITIGISWHRKMDKTMIWIALACSRTWPAKHSSDITSRHRFLSDIIDTRDITSTHPRGAAHNQTTPLSNPLINYDQTSSNFQSRQRTTPRHRMCWRSQDKSKQHKEKYRNFHLRPSAEC